MKFALPMRLGSGVAAALAVLAATGAAQAQAPSASDLAQALRRGGYVVVMRHASSPRTRPSAAEADPANVDHERQLDAAGRKAATEMGAALKALRIPIGSVWTSPAYRARLTASLAGWSSPVVAQALAEADPGMQAAGGSTQATWLKAKTNEAPAAGTDTILVTHFPNISGAFGSAAAGLAEGEALIFRPNPQGAAEFVGRVKIDVWPSLAN